MALNDFFDPFFVWISSNSSKIIFSAVAVIVVVVLYRLLSRQINRWRENQKLEENIAFTLKRIFQWVAVLAIVIIVVWDTLVLGVGV